LESFDRFKQLYINIYAQVSILYISSESIIIFVLFRYAIFKSLLDAIFSYDWKSEKRVTVALINLIGHIVSSNATFLMTAFQMFVKSLLPSLTTTLASGKQFKYDLISFVNLLS
jgi:hypothetical protein